MKIMKKFNKVIAIMMMMSITFAMPAMAGNKPNNHGKNDKVVVVNNEKDSHFDKVVRKRQETILQFRYQQDPCLSS